MKRTALALTALLAFPACKPASSSSSTAHPMDLGSIPGHDSLAQDNSPKQGPRLLAGEVYVRMYTRLFGAFDPADVLQRAGMTDGALLDYNTWSTYNGTIGIPNHAINQPRATNTNVIMAAAYDQLGEALCVNAAATEIHAGMPVAQRRVYRFDVPEGALSAADFAARFDVLHRLFLSYPAAMAPGTRAANYYALYTGTLTRHSDAGTMWSALTPTEAAWASVCAGLIRHPEFHLY